MSLVDNAVPHGKKEKKKPQILLSTKIFTARLPAKGAGRRPGRRRGADPPRRPAEAVERPPLPVQKQGVSFRGTGNFCARTGRVFALIRERTGGGARQNRENRPLRKSHTRRWGLCVLGMGS